MKRDAPRHSSPHSTQAPRIRIVARETRDVPFTISLTSVIIVSPEIATAQIKRSNSLTLTGLKAGETILIASDGRKRHTFLIEVVGRTFATTGRATPLAELSAIEQGGFSGSIALLFSAPLGGSPALLRQSFEMRRTLSPGYTLRLSGEMFKFFGQGKRDLIRSTTLGFGLNRISLGLDMPYGSLDILDSQVNVSPLSFNNFTMRGFHLVSTPGSRLRGVELFAGIARPSLSLLDDSHGRVAGLVLPLAQGETWRVRAGFLAVSPQRGNGVGNGGTIWHIDGRYAPSGNITVEGEAAYANGGLSWRARLDLRRGPFSANGEIVRLDGRSPLVSIGAQPGERKTEAFTFQWRPTARLNASVSYNHTAIAPPATALLRAALDRTTFLATADTSVLCLILLNAIGQAQTKKKAQPLNISTAAPVASPGSGSIINMQVFVSNDIDETLGSGLMTKLSSPVWTYNKVSSTSTLRINYQESVTHKGVDEGTCQWQIRVDDQQSSHPLCDPLYPSVYCMYFTTPLIVAPNVTSISLTSSGLFRGLVAGDHEISIYQRSAGATQCIRNSGGFTTTVTVEEIELP